MDNNYTREDHHGCPQLLDLISKERKWIAKSSQETSSAEDQKLELSLGPPGGEWTTLNKTSQREITDHPNNNNHQNNLISFNYFSNNNPCVRNQVLGSSPWNQHHLNNMSVPSYQSVTMKDSSSEQPCKPDISAEKKSWSPPALVNNNTAVSNGSNSAQKRTAPSPVVGWPPVRSFRKNLANNGTSLKTCSDSPNPSEICGQKKPVESAPKTLFVKINMDGIPIGRKVDLKAYDSYEKLSYAVDDLFRGLLAAQSDNNAGSCGGIKEVGDGVKGGISNLLDGNGEYTLVYEDNEGDRMLVGDVPWHMFVSNVKRLRVLKSSELPKLSGGTKQGKLSLNV